MLLPTILSAAAVLASGGPTSPLPPAAMDMAVGNSWNARLPRDLAAAASAYDLAQIRSDKAALQRLLAWDYTLANSSGQIETKRQFIAEQTAPGYRLEPFVVEQPMNRVLGDIAMLGGVATLKGVDGGKAYSVRLRFMDVWAKRGGKWVVVFTQATRVPAG